MATYGPWIGYLLAALVAGALVWAALGFADTRLNIILLVTGGLIGWIIGILLTPLPKEALRFSEYLTFISTFVGGYLLAKLDRVFNPSAVNTQWVAQLMLFVAGAALGLLSTYVWRSYVAAATIGG